MKNKQPIPVPVDSLRGLPLCYSPDDGKYFRQAGPDDDPSAVLVPCEVDINDPAVIAGMGLRNTG